MGSTSKKKQVRVIKDAWAGCYALNSGLNPDEKIPVLKEMIITYTEHNGFIYLDYFSAMVD